ncbi:hypothetical protein RYA05_02075 [Pseudomonas syringae pv. actinidiae]|nr:hypothetical protein [Pseudomonas syringae pv. actinidiae]
MTETNSQNANEAELDHDCQYEINDWQCRAGGFLWDAGTGEGWDPEDESRICPCCRTRDYLIDAKEDAESCSIWSDCGVSGTGLDIWVSSERTALHANRPEALNALAEIGVVEALVAESDKEGYSVVLCNTQPYPQEALGLKAQN